MKTKHLVRSITTFCAYFLPVVASAQDLPCDVGPRTIRAFSLISTNSISLVWPTNFYRQELRINRRVFTNRANVWRDWAEIYVDTNPATAKTASEYRDTNVASGIHYEYEIRSVITNYECNYRTDVGYWDYQYISTGFDVPLRDRRGNLILLVESGLASALAPEIAQLQDDLVGEGYKLFRHDVAASDVTATDWKPSVAATKSIIRADYNTDPTADWTIFIIGHVPVPYSGESSPGSHTENWGAHPADWYYAVLNDNLWTDTTVNRTTADFPWYWNVPGDGKFDQDFVPDIPDLRIGRVDLRNLPAFGKSEVELMRQYLDRNHAWRHKQFTARDRGLIYNTGYPIESHNVFASFFGSSTNVDLGPWLGVATNPENSYLFAAKQGSGGIDHDNQLGATTDFAANHLYIVFPSMYGSYYGSWDSAMNTNVVMWAPLAAEGYAVATYYHENFVDVDSSAMDEAIGYEQYAMGANRFTNPEARYNPYARIVSGQAYIITEQLKNYQSLLGDPTLRMRVVAPPMNVIVSVDGADNLVRWTAAADTNIVGYYVYRTQTTSPNNFTRVTTSPVNATTYTDSGAAAGSYRYMIRAVKFQDSPNRSYYTASQGIFATSKLALKVKATSSPNANRVLEISGEPGRQYTVEYATSLSDVTVWQPLTTVTLSSPGGAGSVDLANTDQVIFYRVKE
jgi:hypothetical protein